MQFKVPVRREEEVRQEVKAEQVRLGRMAVSELELPSLLVNLV